MSRLETGPKASSTAVKPRKPRFLGDNIKNANANDTFNSVYSNELSVGDLVKKTFSEDLESKNNLQTDSMYSSLSTQSSLGILELENMSDIGNTLKRGTFPINIKNNESILQKRLSQANQTRTTLARASSLKNIFGDEVYNKSIKTSLTDKTQEFEDLLKMGLNITNSSISSEDFISGNEFKENLSEIEKNNRKEYGSLSESRFNFSLEGEKQSIENGSFAAKYFAAKSEPVKDLSAIFPKIQNNDLLSKTLKERVSSNIKSFKEEPTPKEYKTMSSITSWTDSHVSNNMLNVTSLSDISEVLSSKTNLADPKELTKALLSGDLSEDKQFNDHNKFLQRRFSTSTRFSNISQNLEHAEISFSTLGSCSFTSPEINKRNINDGNLEELNKDVNYKNSTKTNHSKCLRMIKEEKLYKKESITDFFFLTPKSGYFEDCTLESNIIEDTINLSSFSILTNNHDVLTEMSFFNKSTNVSKIVYCNETLFQNEVNESPTHNYGTKNEMLEIGDICIGTYSQAVITLENRLTIGATYTLNLLGVTLNDTKNMIVESKSIRKNVATVLCSNKTQLIPALSEATFIIGIIPLVSGSIIINIKLESNDVCQQIYRNIQIHSIEPQITWVNNSLGSIDFGLLPELSQSSHPIKLLNKGTFQVPIKLILSQNHCDDVIQAKAIINSSELWQCDLNILTPNFSKNNCKTKLITGRLKVVLDSVEEIATNYSSLLYSSNLLGRVGLTDISFDQNPLTLKKYGHSTMCGVIEIYNNSEMPLSLFVLQNSKQLSEFNIQPDKFQLAVDERIKMKITYSPSNSLNYFNEKSISLQVVSSQKQFKFNVNCTEPNPTEFQFANSPTSRPISPWSTNSSNATGQLELESTCSSLIWGSVPPNTKSLQTFTLRNRGQHKEKLHLYIKDNKNCFKLIYSGENQVSEMKLLLEPMESQKLSVVLTSTSNEGQAYGQVVIKRQHSCEKRVVSLYGYCGYSNIIISGPFEDNFGKMWLYPDSQHMTCHFSVTNSGNTTAFVKICQENSLDDIIKPNEFILKKGETTKVEITIVMSPERLEVLLEQDSSSKNININKISLIYGDEVSRVRVSRVWNKIKHEKKIVYPDERCLNEISNMFNGSNCINLSHLHDSEKSLFKLWQMGIKESDIIILMEKSNLESLLCETTVLFSDLETTVVNRLSE